ncbi:MAG: hypothetical protein K6C99_05935 [Lachnospiraceae bacterium]|nr:hypothetical protein [Lachnospiraceae bacterium]
MQTVLGHGITREKLIIAKLLDAAILLFSVYLVIIATAFIAMNTESAVVIDTPSEEERLKCDICGIPLENPFMLSSSAVAPTYDMCAIAFEAGWFYRSCK